MANKLLDGNKILSYPLGLASDSADARGNAVQYMMFKINDSVTAQKLKDDSGSGPVVVTNNRVGTGVATTITSTKELAKEVDPALQIKYSKASIENEQWRTQKGMVRLDRVIVLPMPNEHVVGTSVAYDTDYDSSLLTKLGDTVNQLGNGVIGELATLGKNAAISSLANRVKSGLTSTRDLLAEERLALNPKKEVMFKSIGYRQFSFRFQFAPKSQKESEEVNRIIETFRYYSLPEISPSKFFYTFPAEFNISFIHGTSDNPNIPKITTSVLQRVGVNYSPNSTSWTTLPNGSPVAIDLSLDFMEMSIIDRGMVWTKDRPITSGH